MINKSNGVERPRLHNGHFQCPKFRFVPGNMKGAKAHPYGQPSSGTRSLGLSFKNQSILEKEFRFRNAVLTNRGHHLPQKYKGDDTT